MARNVGPYCASAILIVSIFTFIVKVNGEWSDPNREQFHIQTDEGPDRYFKYQTLSGQYRKERRLEDGTVVGSYGWVDADGYLRMREYVADNAGYRITKNKNVFVGKSRPISEALVIAKKAPSESETLVNTNVPTKSTAPPYYNQSPYNGPTTVTSFPIGFNYEHSKQPEFKYSTIPQSPVVYNRPSSSPYVEYTPNVEISHNSIPSSTERPISVTPIIPSSTILPPNLPTSTVPPPIVSTTPSTLYIPSTTSHHVSSIQSTTPAYILPDTFIPSKPSPFRVPSTNYGLPITSTLRNVPPTPTYYKPTYLSTRPPPISSNDLDSSFYSSDPQYEHYPEDEQTFSNPYVYRNGPTYPIDSRGHTYSGNGYNRQFPLYDGVSVTNDGFRYYIPRQYHEEQNLGDRKSGSFGYIDPFGIRRVIYYNAGPDGFKHRKNNRYVGFNATPYDPRPS